jgi:Epoxide hydrolase N terminus
VTLLEPFRIAAPRADLIDLRRRLSAARWPTRETVSDWSQGLPLSWLKHPSDHEGDLWEILSQDQVLDNITLYWLTRTGASSARLYWESIAEVTAWFSKSGGDRITVPTGCTVFPQEVPHPYRRWAEPRFPSIVHWGEPVRGGHFGAWEQPGLFISEVRARQSSRGGVGVSPTASRGSSCQARRSCNASLAGHGA